jgi:hypothetical protein
MTGSGCNEMPISCLMSPQKGVAVAWVERPHTDALVLGPCGQEAIGGKGHTVDGGTVEGQLSQRLHCPPVKYPDAVVPACSG